MALVALTRDSAPAASGPAYLLVATLFVKGLSSTGNPLSQVEIIVAIEAIHLLFPSLPSPTEFPVVSTFLHHPLALPTELRRSCCTNEPTTIGNLVPLTNIVLRTSPIIKSPGKPTAPSSTSTSLTLSHDEILNLRLAQSSILRHPCPLPNHHWWLRELCRQGLVRQILRIQSPRLVSCPIRCSSTTTPQTD